VQEHAAFLRAEDTRIGDEFTFEVECNWKFIPENLMDMYHVGVIHGSSFGAYFPVAKFPYELTRYGYHAEYESLTMAPEGAWLFGKAMPWLEDKNKHFAFTTFIRPTYNMFARPDMLQPWYCHPISPNRTRVTILTQYPEEWFEQPAFNEKNALVKDFIRLVASEDLEMLKSLQNGVGSRMFNAGPTTKLEKAIHHTLNYYLDRMFGEEAREVSGEHAA
jgi:Rieske 2Fe-2S family protein